jgi:hypothetical protein
VLPQVAQLHHSHRPVRGIGIGGGVGPVAFPRLLPGDSIDAGRPLGSELDY